jgi:type III secretion system FlhB-like substrate exporter
MTNETFINNFEAAENGTCFEADALLVSRNGLVVALKIDVKAVRDRNIENMSCFPSVYRKGTGWQGKKMREMAFQKRIPICQCEYTVLKDIFDTVDIGDELSFEQFKEIYIPIAHRDVMDSFMIGRRQRKSVARDKQRFIRKGHMYKVFVENRTPMTGYYTFSLWGLSGDEEAIKMAYSNANLKEGRHRLLHCCLLNDDCPDYTFPFKVFCVSVDGQDRLVHQYAPPHSQKPPWDVYVLIGCQKNYNNAACYYSKDSETAIREAHHHVRHSLIKCEYREQIPEDYAPCPYQVFHKGKLIYEYSPPQNIDVNPEYLNENIYGY